MAKRAIILEIIKVKVIIELKEYIYYKILISLKV